MFAGPVPVMATGIVKQIISGDTYILYKPSKNVLILPEVRVCLACVATPRLSVKTSNFESDDENFAWEARELVIPSLIGSTVQYKVLYTEKGVDYIQIADENNEDVEKKLISVGLAKLRTSQAAQKVPYYSELEKLQEEAKKKNLNLWGSKKGIVRNISYISNDLQKTKEFFSNNKLKRIKAIIEYVVNATLFRLYFPDEQIYTSLQLSGVELKKVSQEVCFGPVSKFFVERRLLNRWIDIRLEGVDDKGQLLGTVLHAKGNITILLLENGFVGINLRTAKVNPDISELSAAQNKAKENKRGIWRNLKTESENSNQYIAKIIEVVSADCYIIGKIDERTGNVQEKRVYLSYIRCPRMGTKNRQSEPYAVEAREAARKKLIGKKVKVIENNVKQLPNSVDNLTFVSIIMENNKFDAAKYFIGLGLGQLNIRSDEKEAYNYADLVLAETKAKENRLGTYREKPYEAQRINNLTGPDQVKRAKAMSRSLLDECKFEGVVEHVSNGNSFKIFITNHNLIISLLLAGIRCPKMTKGLKVKQSQTFAEEAYRFSRHNYLQRNVGIKLYDCEKHGSFIGEMTFNKKVVNVELALNGLADVVILSPKSTPSSLVKQLEEAKEKAVSEKLNIWSIETPSVPLVQECVKYIIESATISHAESLFDFSVRNTENPEFDTLNENIKNLTENPASKIDKYSETSKPEIGELLLAYDKFDESWHRGNVLAASNQNVQVLFIDHGFINTVNFDMIRRIPKDMMNPPYAIPCFLSGELSVETNSIIGIKEYPGFEVEAFETFAQLCRQKTVKVIIEYFRPDVKKSGVQIYTKFKPETNVAEMLIQKGLVLYDKNNQTETGDALMLAQSKARQSRLNIWENGDIDDDSDSEF